CTFFLFPVQKLLVRLSERIIPDDRKEDEVELDERLLITPAVALDQCRSVINTMAKTSIEAIKLSFTLIGKYDESLVDPIIELEDKTDRYEDILSTYLIKFSSRKINSADSMKATEYLKCIGDFERMADHSINIARNAKEMDEKEIVFPESTKDDISVLLRAVTDICEKTVDTFLNEDIAKAYDIEPLEQVIDKLKEEIRIRHIKKMQQGICSMHEGFVLGDLLTNLERISDHCSNIAGCMIDSRENNLLLHTTLGAIKNTDEFKLKYDGFLSQYALAEIQS
ncbi:MAG TPA: Na/Pi cotransporter, partial [Spirochaetaceae bacterium]|nr:Na/Pi cotransporter [Spirochaetaceae bacterium]